MYEEMEDTSWITGLRQIGDAGNQGILDNYSKVNVFDDTTRADLEGRVNAIYNRTLNDFDRDYTNTMNKTLARDYGRFGTTNATPALYNRDTYNLQQQRKLADLQYQKAATYDTFLNNELQRRYNTLNMFKGMSDMGVTPYQLDLANWQIRNNNKDRQWMNDIDARNASNALWSNIVTMIPTAIGAGVGGYFGGPQGAQAGAASGKALGEGISGIAFGGQQSYGNNTYAGNTTNIADALLEGLGSVYNIYGSSWGQNNNNNSMSGLSNYINSYISGGGGNSYNSSALGSALDSYLGGSDLFGTLGVGNNVI